MILIITSLLMSMSNAGYVADNCNHTWSGQYWMPATQSQCETTVQPELTPNAEQGDVVVADVLYFDTASALIQRMDPYQAVNNDHALTQLANSARYYQKMGYQLSKVVVRAYADQRGDHSSNLDLTNMRGTVAYNAMFNKLNLKSVKINLSVGWVDSNSDYYSKDCRTNSYSYSKQYSEQYYYGNNSGLGFIYDEACLQQDRRAEIMLIMSPVQKQPKKYYY